MNFIEEFQGRKILSADDRACGKEIEKNVNLI